ncbi:DUF4030 domain-containing protein [Solibacillus cecembensis]|uniref:DUF4030 domain-containing protein n=1 Tax=Solibacillus cecembensis TaxID=459347 RepID=UPI003D052A27
MKNFIAVFIIIVAIVLVINIDVEKNDSFASNNDDEKRWDRILSVLETAVDEFELFSFSVTPESIIFIEMGETKSELQLIKYLEENVNKNDLNHYTIDITRKSLQDVENERFMDEVSSIVYDYIQEKNYHDMELYHHSIEPEPILKISILKSNDRSSEIIKDRSSEIIKKELEDLLASKSAELSKKDISYEIQVIERTNESTIESDAVISAVVEDFRSTGDHLIISSTDIFKGNGIYKKPWTQPSDSKDYKFHVTNNTGTNVTVQIQQSGYTQTQTYNLVAYGSTTWVQSDASSGDHTIIVTTSDGSIFKGDVFVSSSDVSLN